MPTTRPNKKAEKLISGVTTLHDEALELAESVLFMATKLEQIRKDLEWEPLTVTYDNGGGQTGTKENPMYTAYEKLLSTYIKSLDQLTKIVEKGKTEKKASGIMAELSTIAGRKVG